MKKLDLSCQSFLVMTQHNGNMLDPKGDLMLVEGEYIVMDTQKRIANANLIDI